MVDLVIYLLLLWAIRRGSPSVPSMATRWPLHVPSRLTQGSSPTHPGVDICPVDDRGSITRVLHPVYPIASGSVVGVATTKRGRWISIEHPNGVRTSYGHLSSTAVVAGQRVTTDTELGRLGYDPLDPERIVHLHLQAQARDGRPIAPERVLGAAEGDTRQTTTPDDLETESLTA